MVNFRDVPDYMRLSLLVQVGINCLKLGYVNARVAVFWKLLQVLRQNLS